MARRQREPRQQISKASSYTQPMAISSISFFKMAVIIGQTPTVVLSRTAQRLLLEVVEALVSVWGGDRVAVRIGPSGTWNGMSDSNPLALFDYVAEQLNRFGLAYLHIIEPRVKGNVLIAEGQAPVASEQLRKIFKGKISAAGGFEPDSAEAIVEKGDADLVTFGRYFISNPDLPKRIKLRLPLNDYDRTTFYTFDARGYTDYPFYSEQAAS